jgi:hypothetical protein
MRMSSPAPKECSIQPLGVVLLMASNHTDDRRYNGARAVDLGSGALNANWSVLDALVLQSVPYMRSADLNHKICKASSNHWSDFYSTLIFRHLQASHPRPCPLWVRILRIFRLNGKYVEL